MKILIAGLDPSMSNLGIVCGVYDTELSDYSLSSCHLVQTFPGTDKKVRKSSQDYERCRQLYGGMAAVLNNHLPVICFAEMPTGSQSASGMKSYGISLMLLGTIGVPVIQVSPQEVKVAATGSKNSSKDTMIKWAMKRHPDLTWLTRTVKGEVQFVKKNEHMADAAAAVEAGLQTDQWKQLISVLAGTPAAPVV